MKSKNQKIQKISSLLLQKLISANISGTRDGTESDGNKEEENTKILGELFKFIEENQFFSETLIELIFILLQQNHESLFTYLPILFRNLNSSNEILKENSIKILTHFFEKSKSLFEKANKNTDSDHFHFFSVQFQSQILKNLFSNLENVSVGLRSILLDLFIYFRPDILFSFLFDQLIIYSKNPNVKSFIHSVFRHLIENHK